MICKICGKEFTKADSSWYSQEICSDQCFNDGYWLERVRNKEKFTIIDGKCYYFDKNHPIENDYKDMLGFGGDMFNIRFFNGSTYKTNNLWLNGEIPTKFRSELSDNAEFIKNEVR